MENKQKAELRKIIKDIPISEIDKKISVLWNKYGYSFNYQTFRNYFKALRKYIK